MAEAQQTVRMDALELHDNGRVTIPKQVRDKYDLEPGQLLVVRLLTDNAEQKDQFHRKMADAGRITVASRLRSKYDLSDGDNVNIELVF